MIDHVMQYAGPKRGRDRTALKDQSADEAPTPPFSPDLSVLKSHAHGDEALERRIEEFASLYLEKSSSGARRGLLYPLATDLALHDPKLTNVQAYEIVQRAAESLLPPDQKRTSPPRG